jgi:hypothetical protein
MNPPPAAYFQTQRLTGSTRLLKANSSQSDFVQASIEDKESPAATERILPEITPQSDDIYNEAAAPIQAEPAAASTRNRSLSAHADDFARSRRWAVYL